MLTSISGGYFCNSSMSSPASIAPPTKQALSTRREHSQNQKGLFGRQNGRRKTNTGGVDSSTGTSFNWFVPIPDLPPVASLLGPIFHVVFLCPHCSHVREVVTIAAKYAERLGVNVFEVSFLANMAN